MIVSHVFFSRVFTLLFNRSIDLIVFFILLMNKCTIRLIERYYSVYFAFPRVITNSPMEENKDERKEGEGCR